MPKQIEHIDHDVEIKHSYLEQSLQYMTEEFVHKLRELSIVKRIADSLVDSADQKKVCLEITKIILDEIHAEFCSLYLLNNKKNKLLLKSSKRLGDDEGEFFEDAKINAFSLSDGLAGAVLNSGKSVYIKNNAKDNRYKGDPLLPDSMQSVLCLPLISAKVAVGILVLSAPETDAFIKDDDRLFQIIGNQIANVLKNVDLVRNIQKSSDRREEVLKKLKIAEKKLSDYTKDLEEVIEKRTNELVQSEKLASIGQLVSGVAHELNNPLTIVIGLIDLMIDSNDMPAKQKKRLKKVHTATMRCAKVVENLIKFSRKEVVHNETIDINSIVEETIGFFEYQFMVNNISLKKSIQKNIPPTVGDPQQLKQVFLNIISNAYDSMVSQDNEKLLEVTTHSDDKTIIIEFRRYRPRSP